METKYRSTAEGKAAYVNDLLKPALIAADMGIVDAVYEDGQYEYVNITNKNPDKSVKVNVSCDSIQALLEDVIRAIFA